MVIHSLKEAARRSGDPVMNPTSTISVIAPAATEFGRQILKGVRTYCKENPGLSMDLVSTHTVQKAQLSPRGSPLVASLSTLEELETIAPFFTSVVCVSNRLPTSGFACVLNDDVAVGRMAAQYLLSLGYRQLAFLAHGHFHYSLQRETGFRETAEKAGATLHLFEGVRQVNMPQVAAALLAMDNPVAVMAPSDLVARWLIQSVPHPEENIPDRIAVLGVDDDPLESSLSPVNISSIRLSGERLGYEAAALGLRLAAGAAPPPHPVLVPPARIVARQSTNRLAVRDRLIVRTVKHMSENLISISSVSDVVSALKINRRPLEMRFKRVLGNTIANELTRLRIHRTRELLATTNISIKEIAYLVGYSEPRMLSIAFKRETGESPSDYRTRVSPGS